MTAAKITPGPWVAGQGTSGAWFIETTAARIRKSICYIYSNRRQEEQAANAKAIAAVPELIEALLPLVPMLKDAKEAWAGRHLGGVYVPIENMERAEAALKLAGVLL